MSVVGGGGGGSNVDEAALLRFVLRAFVLCRPEIGYTEIFPLVLRAYHMYFLPALTFDGVLSTAIVAPRSF